MIGTLPSCQSSSKNVQVFDQLVFDQAMGHLLESFPSPAYCRRSRTFVTIATPERWNGD